MSATDSRLTPAATAAGERTIEVVANPPQARPLTAVERERAAANAGSRHHPREIQRLVFVAICCSRCPPREIAGRQLSAPRHQPPRPLNKQTAAFGREQKLGVLD
jgi:hypothetical protein